MLRNLAANLVLHERIQTTDAKAKELRRIADRLVTRATRLGDMLVADVGKLKDEDREAVLARRVHAHRTVASFLPKLGTRTLSDGTIEQVDLVHKLFHEIAPRYLKRVQEGKGGGYTRITKLIARRGDNAPISVIEFLPGEPEGKAKKKAGKADKPAKGAKAAAEAAAEEKPKKKGKAAAAAEEAEAEAPKKKSKKKSKSDE